MDWKSEKGYIDLGTAGYVTQILIALGLSGLVTLKVYWKKVKYWFKRKKDDEKH